MNKMQKIFLVVWTPVMLFMLWNIFMITPENIRFGIMINIFFLGMVLFCLGAKEENEEFINRIPVVRWLVN